MKLYYYSILFALFFSIDNFIVCSSVNKKIFTNLDDEIQELCKLDKKLYDEGFNRFFIEEYLSKGLINPSEKNFLIACYAKYKNISESHRPLEYSMNLQAIGRYCYKLEHGSDDELRYDKNDFPCREGKYK